MNLVDFFFDPVLRAPMWGCLFMSIASSLMGVVIFLRKKSLLSETLSHATYPGALLGMLFFAIFFSHLEEWAFFSAFIGAFASSLAALKGVDYLEEKAKVRTDAALCFVLSVFFGIGVVLASVMQRAWPLWYAKAQTLLLGQAATMDDAHIWIYGGLSLAVIAFIFLSFRSLQLFLFNPDFALSLKLPVKHLQRMIFWLLIFSFIIGIRSVGIVLMLGMVIAPAVAARQFSNRLQTIFTLAAMFGSLSAILGNFLSVQMHLPTGPMIVLIASGFSFFSLCFAPKRGIFFKMIRIFSFRLQCLEENLLKGMWKNHSILTAPTWTVKIALWRLKRQGWVDAYFQLTEDGRKKASSIVRLHRLWELYLTKRLGLQAEKVHRTAEEMEHILTRDMELRLTHLLENPQHDPHDQPIPEREL